MRKLSSSYVGFCLVALFLLLVRSSSVYQSSVRNQNAITLLSFVKLVPVFSPDTWTTTCPIISQPVPSVALEQDIHSSTELGRGELDYYLGKYHDAIRILNQIDAPPGSKALADFFVGASYICLEDAKRAAMYWRDGSLAWRAFASIWRCQLAKQTTRCATLYDLALASQPIIWEGWRIGPKPIIWTYLAAAQIPDQRGDRPAKLHWLQLAWIDYPHSAITTYLLGEFYELDGDLRTAQDYYQRAVVLEPNNEPNLYLHLARVSLGLSDWDLAGQSIETLVTKVAPESEWHWDRSVELVRQYANTPFCRRISAMLEQGTQTPVSKMIVNRIVDIRAACSAYIGAR